VRRHVLALRRDRQNLTVKADSGVLESNSLNRGAHAATLERRPELASSHSVRTVNLNLDGSAGLLVKLEDLHRVGIHAVLDVIDSKTTLRSRGRASEIPM
jgi:hypothetical protein